MATRDEPAPAQAGGDRVVRMPKRSTLMPPGGKAVPEAEEAAAMPLVDDVDPLPEPDDPYKAYGRPGNKPEVTLHVLFKDGSMRGFAWSNFDSVDMLPVPGGKVLVARFNGLEPTELRLCGGNLGRLHVLIGQNRVAWMREHPSRRGFGGAATDDKAEVITGIIPSPWQPARQAGGIIDGHSARQ
jgi:hypothetical protein